MEKRLEAIERLARGSVAQRFFSDPLRYIFAIGFWRIIYPIRKKGKYAQAKTFFGVDMQVILPAATEIFLFGAKTHDSEIRLARFLMKNLKAGDVFCDVGAHFGYFTLLASHLVGIDGKVLAVEASQSTFGILKKNTSSVSNVEAVHLAASDEDKLLVFNEFPPLLSEYNSLVLPEKDSAWLKNNPPKKIEVQGVKMDDFFKNQRIRPSIVKMDVEGAEPQVLRGMEGFLKNEKPILIMEYLISQGQNEAHREAVKYAKQLGYQLFRIKNDGEIAVCDDLESAMRNTGLDSDNVVLKKQ